ncbi:MAG TPA: hypothetical protein DDW24_04045 [Blastocatellia bacterium]|nr:hypothetical protein [Blastocatellia bacterium]
MKSGRQLTHPSPLLIAKNSIANEMKITDPNRTRRNTITSANMIAIVGIRWINKAKIVSRTPYPALNTSKAKTLMITANKIPSMRGLE